jgi:hypothetical protein
MMFVDDAGRLRHLWRTTATKLDLTGLKCPLPALKALKALQPGDLLEVHCTDPLSDRHSQPDPGNRRQGRDHLTRGTAHHIPDRKGRRFVVCCRSVRDPRSGPIGAFFCTAARLGKYRYLLPIDIRLGFCPNSFSFSAGVRRLSCVAGTLNSGRDTRGRHWPRV